MGYHSNLIEPNSNMNVSHKTEDFVNTTFNPVSFLVAGTISLGSLLSTFVETRVVTCIIPGHHQILQSWILDYENVVSVFLLAESVLSRLTLS